MVKVTLDQIGVFMGAAALAAALAALAASAITVVRGVRGRCPGPRLGAGVWAWPVNWLTPQGCGYDRRGIVGGVCPECGSGRGARAGALAGGAAHLLAAMALAVSGCGLWNARWVISGQWTRYAPTVVLLGVERVAPDLTHGRARHELITRLRRGGMGSLERRWIGRVALASLGDDDVAWNMDWGVDVLGELGDEGLAVLETALRDRDWQRRQIAGEALRRRWLHAAGYFYDTGPFRAPEVSDALLDVCVEALRDDWCGDVGGMSCSNAYTSCLFLGALGARADPWLVRAMHSWDEQRCLLAACAAACGGHTAIYDEAVPICIEHLVDNHEEYDAAIAAYSLFCMGQRALGPLGKFIDNPDPQRRALARRVSRELGAPVARADGEEELVVREFVRGAGIDPCRGLRTGSLGYFMETLVKASAAGSGGARVVTADP